jgi:hypothetical protein
MFFLKISSSVGAHLRFWNVANISRERRNAISEASMYEMNASRIFNHQQKGKRRKKSGYHAQKSIR